jgi:DNA-binding PadR family transcriptional regulator
MRTSDDDWGLTRLYILHEATKEPVFSTGMKQKLERHGVLLSAASVARMLRGMQDKGYLMPAQRTDGRPLKRYVATRRGQAAVDRTRDKVRALFLDLSITNRGNGQIGGRHGRAGR